MKNPQKYRRISLRTNVAKLLILRETSLREQGVGGSSPVTPTIVFRRTHRPCKGPSGYCSARELLQVAEPEDRPDLVRASVAIAINCNFLAAEFSCGCGRASLQKDWELRSQPIQIRFDARRLTVV